MSKNKRKMNDLAVCNNQDSHGVDIGPRELHVRLVMPLFLMCDVNTIDPHPVSVRPAHSFIF